MTPLRKRLLFGLCCLLGNACAAAVSTGAVHIDARPALEGWVRQGEQAEILVQLSAADSAEVELDLSSAEQLTRHRVFLPAGETLRIGLPYPAIAGHPLMLHAVSAETVLHEQALTIRFLQPSQRLLVVIANAEHDKNLEALQLGSDVQLLQTSTDELPRSGQGYQPVDAMVLDSAALSAMTRPQRLALADFVSACGPVYLLRASAAQLAELRQHGGCGGRSLHLWETLKPDELALLASHTAMPPEDFKLLRLLAREHRGSYPGSHPAVAIVLLLALYLLAVIALARWSGSARSVLVLPVVCSLGALLFWQDRNPEIGLLEWREADSGDPSGSVSAVMGVTGLGDWKGFIPLPQGSGSPGFGAAGKPTVVIAEAGQISLGVQTGLFSFEQLHLHYTRPLQDDLHLAQFDGEWRVDRTSSTGSGPMYLQSGDTLYQVPRLNPGQSWIPTDDAVIHSTATEFRLLRRRLKGSPAALLAKQADGWLLLRVRDDQANDAGAARAD